MEVFAQSDGEKAKTREGGRELDSDTLLGTRKRFSVTYLVKPSTGESPASMDEEDAMAATGVPSLRDLVNSAYCIGKFAREIDDMNGVWEVVAYFDSKSPATEPTMEWWWDAETYEKIVQRDPITGKPIVNAVGEPLLITRPVTVPILIVERIEDSFDPDTILQFCDHINASEFVGAPPGCALMSRILDAPVYQAGQRLRKVTYNVKFDLSPNPDSPNTPLGWKVQLLNHGTKYKIFDLDIDRLVNEFKEVRTGDFQLYPFMDLNKNPTTGNLAADGTRLPDGDPEVWLGFDRFPSADFDQLNINPYA